LRILKRLSDHQFERAVSAARVVGHRLDAPSAFDGFGFSQDSLTSVLMHRILYVQVLAAIALGIAVGYVFPTAGTALKPLGDAFIALIKMMIAPVIFCTVVHGIGTMGDLKKVARIGWKTLIYFEVVSTLALVIGVLVGEIVQPGTGFKIDPMVLDAKAVASYVSRTHEEGIVKHLLAIVPTSFLSALADGDLLQVLLIAILSGVAIARMGELGQRSAARSMPPDACSFASSA
jgi:aerobic C4-dicarboxylate transport protein